MKIFTWISNNIFFLFTLFLLSFIPLYPKWPLVDVSHTWVYIRAEDFIVVFVLMVWILFLIRKKVSLKTPLTIPILLFWIIGAVTTIHGVILIFPTLANVFPNVAFLSFMRHIEYMSLFFIAYSGMKDKRSLSYIIATLVVTLLLVTCYGLGQKYFGFPAYLTMNEEFAKGEAIRLSQLSRVSSTFAGHYDLAAYLVFILPILISLIFGFRNKLVKLLLAASVCLGFVTLFMTVSRVSFFVVFICLFIVLLFQKRKLALLSLPIIALIAFILLSFFSGSLFQRFGNTVKDVDVLIDAKTGEAIGNVKIVSRESFRNKIIKRKFVKDKLGLNTAIATVQGTESASSSALVLFETLPQMVPLVVPVNISTGENLPQGTGYINLSLSPVISKSAGFFYENPTSGLAENNEVLIFLGDFLIKRVSAYDLSFTTRFQGEWPHALAAFQRNILFGSGYGSVGLAVDNNYFRMLGEIGLLGVGAFFIIFVIIGIYIQKTLKHIDSPTVRAYVVGFAAGTIGLLLNALLIDVFEASKIAFLFWLLTGVTLGILRLYQSGSINLYQEVKKAFTSSLAIIIYIAIVTIVIFSPMINNYFVGDDFTWFRWAADCGSQVCPSAITQIMHYFINANGFFYRPGTKVFFLLMYKLFWLNQSVYHEVSLFLHFVVTSLFFLLARKVLKSKLLASLAAFSFLILSGYHEAVFWISSIGFLFNAVFILLSLLFYILWEEKRKMLFFIASFLCIGLSLLFHELGVIAPLLILVYKLYAEKQLSFNKIYKDVHYMFLFTPVLSYLIIRYFAKSHWFAGDYNYNLIKLPFNIIGNFLGYISITLLGPSSLPLVNSIRNFSKVHLTVSLIASIGIVLVLALSYKLIIKKIDIHDRKIILFSLLFSFVSLLPFLGLGNISSRYSYLSALGLIILFVFLAKKLYIYLLSNGREIALGSVAVLSAIFFLMHIIQLQQVHGDWNGAGERTRRFFVSIDSLYSDYWSKEPMEFHFVNVPTRTGEAWVFPVGLEDALWLIFRNPNIHIYKWQNVKQALDSVTDAKHQKVLLFDDSGAVVEKQKQLRIK